MQQILYISTREKLETTKNQTTKEKQTTKTREKERKSPSPQNKIYHPEKREKREKAAVTGLKLAYQILLPHEDTYKILRTAQNGPFYLLLRDLIRFC